MGDYSIPAAGEIRAGDMAEIKVKSELNAIVWKIEAAAGVSVNAGDTLIILESMKMEIPVAAPRSGTVRTILVNEGQQVAEGQPLAILQF
jgi:acetyl-CoA carboxylase biotin carboxyl carrier protein